MKNNRLVIAPLRLAGWLFMCSLLLAAPLVTIAPKIDAAKLLNRRLVIGDTTAGATTKYTYEWGYPTNTPLGSIRFLICTDPFYEDPCTPPPGADFSGATLFSQATETGFSILSQSTNEIILSRAPAPTQLFTLARYEFTNVVNQTDIGTFYVRILTYPTNNASGAYTEGQSVVNSTVENVTINTEVPPFLFFCLGITVGDICDTVSGSLIDYGTLTSTDTAYGTSQFAVATNAQNGYSVSAVGTTMTSGNKIIPQLSLSTASIPGDPQFGLNLRANSVPPVGQDISGIGVGAVAAGYDTPDVFKFVTGDVVASATTESNFNKYTQSYIVNIPADQPYGIYSTTITYICTGSF